MKIAINAINSNTSLRGVDRYIIELVTHLRTIDNSNSYYVFYANWQRFIRILDFSKINLIELAPPRNKFLRALWQIIFFPQLLSKFNPDILHYTNPIPFIWKMCPVIFTIHDMAEFSNTFKYGRLNSYFKRIIVKLGMHLSDKIITVSNYSKQQILESSKIISEKISVTPEGASYHLLKPKNCSEIIEKYSLPAEYILFVGAIEEGKNIETILYAFSSLRDSLKRNLNILLVGSKGRGYNKIAKTIGELDLRYKVYTVGHVPDEDLFCLYKKAKIFIFLSLIEGFGLPVLEAMASGVPVVASNRTSLPEVCGDAAILVDPLNRDEIRGALERIIEDKVLAHSLIEKGYERAKMLSWDVTAKETLNEYRVVALSGVK